MQHHARSQRGHGGERPKHQLTAAHDHLDARTHHHPGEQVRDRPGIRCVPTTQVSPGLGVGHDVVADRVVGQVKQTMAERGGERLRRAAVVQPAGIGEDDDTRPASGNISMAERNPGNVPPFPRNTRSRSSRGSKAKPIPVTRGSGWNCERNIDEIVSVASTRPSRSPRRATAR